MARKIIHTGKGPTEIKPQKNQCLFAVAGFPKTNHFVMDLIRKRWMKKMIKSINMIKKEIELRKIVVKKITMIKIVVVVAVVVVIITSVAKINKTNINYNQTITYQLNNNTYHLLIADNPKLWERGLMYVRKKEGFDGMIFYFPEKKYRSFWNKNTLVDLDIYWLVDKKIISKAMLPSVTKNGLITISSSEPVNRVIEIIR